MVTLRFADSLPPIQHPPSSPSLVGTNACVSVTNACPCCFHPKAFPADQGDTLSIRSFCPHCALRSTPPRAPTYTLIPPIGTREGWELWCWGGSIGVAQHTSSRGVGGLYFDGALIACFPLTWAVGIRRWLRTSTPTCTERGVTIAVMHALRSCLTPISPSTPTLLATALPLHSTPIVCAPFQCLKWAPTPLPDPVLVWPPPARVASGDVSSAGPSTPSSSGLCPSPRPRSLNPPTGFQRRQDIRPEDTPPPARTGADGFAGRGSTPGAGKGVLRHHAAPVATGSPPTQSGAGKPHLDNMLPTSGTCLPKGDLLAAGDVAEGTDQDTGQVGGDPAPLESRGFSTQETVVKADGGGQRGPSTSHARAGGPPTRKRGTKGVTHTDTWGLSPTHAASLATPWVELTSRLSPSDLWHLCTDTILGERDLFPPGPTTPLPFFDGRVFADEEVIPPTWSHPHQPALDGTTHSRSGYHLHPDEWLAFFKGHPHAHALHAWARWGFPALCSLGANDSRVTPNGTLSIDAQAATTEWLAAEVAAGKTWRLGTDTPSPAIVSPLCVAPKPGSDKLRICHNLSAPFGGSSVNANSTYAPHCEPMTLSSVLHLARQGRFARATSPEGVAYVAKVDLKSCYRQFALRSRDIWLHCLEWEGHTYAHAFVIWGSRPAAHLVSIPTQAICDQLQPLLPPGTFLSVYLDDFHIIARTKQDADYAVHLLRDTLSRLGLIESVDKFHPPSTAAPTLGVFLDLARGCVWVLPEHAIKLARGIADMLSGGTAKRQLESLVGSLNFIEPLFINARLRLVCLWRWLAQWEAGSPWRQHPSAECRDALQWWHDALSACESHAGASFEAGIKRPIPVICGVSSDSCDTGFAWICEHLACYIAGSWRKEEFQCMSSNLRELLAFTMGIIVHAPLLSGFVVYADTDSATSFYAVLNQGSDRAAYRFLLRLMFWHAERYRFRVAPRHLPGSQNQIADRPSRGQWPDEWLRPTALLSSRLEPTLARYHVNAIPLLARFPFTGGSPPLWVHGRDLEAAAHGLLLSVTGTTVANSMGMTGLPSPVLVLSGLRELCPAFL
jgi:hypothetical protein